MLYLQTIVKYFYKLAVIEKSVIMHVQWYFFFFNDFKQTISEILLDIYANFGKLSILVENETFFSKLRNVLIELLNRVT